MALPKLYRKVWLAIDCSDENEDYYEYVEARRALRENKDWFWQLLPDYRLYYDDILSEEKEWWLEEVYLKQPAYYDNRNVYNYNRRPIIKKEIKPIDNTINDVDFDSDIPF